MEAPGASSALQGRWQSIPFPDVSPTFRGGGGGECSRGPSLPPIGDASALRHQPSTGELSAPSQFHSSAGKLSSSLDCNVDGSKGLEVGENSAKGFSSREGDWPCLGESAVKRVAKRRLTMAPGELVGLEQGSSAYQPSTARGRQFARDCLAQNIKIQLFCSKPVSDEIEDLATAATGLEDAMNWMKNVQWGAAITQAEQRCYQVAREGFGIQTDVRYDHSWVPEWPGPKPGFHWIPKGAISLDIQYPARRDEVLRFGHLAKKVRVRHPPAPLSRTFVQAVRGEMANQGRGKRRLDEGRQEEWMEEDDLLGLELKEQDLRNQLQRSRLQGGTDRQGRSGFHGPNQMGREQERSNYGRGAVGNRPQYSQNNWSQQVPGGDNWGNNLCDKREVLLLDVHRLKGIARMVGESRAELLMLVNIIQKVIVSIPKLI